MLAETLALVRRLDDPHDIAFTQNLGAGFHVLLRDPDTAIDPGQLAVVKVHARWRSGAWWVARALSNSLDIGLY